MAPKSSSRSGAARPASFIGKTYELINNIETDNLICWDHSGETFTVFNPERLAADVFPGIFNHASYPSFTRALNAYGFRQVSRNKWKHPEFRRGNTAALANIQRRRPAAKRSGGISQGDSGAASLLGAGSTGSGDGIQLNIQGMSAEGCTQLIEAQRTMLTEVRKEINQLRDELQVARTEEVQMRTSVAHVLGALVQEYGRNTIEAALGAAPESFMHYADAHGIQRAASEWLDSRKESATPRITYSGASVAGADGSAGSGHHGGGGGGGGSQLQPGIETELSSLLKALGVVSTGKAGQGAGSQDVTMGGHHAGEGAHTQGGAEQHPPFAAFAGAGAGPSAKGRFEEIPEHSMGGGPGQGTSRGHRGSLEAAGNGLALDGPAFPDVDAPQSHPPTPTQLVERLLSTIAEPGHAGRGADGRQGASPIASRDIFEELAASPPPDPRGGSPVPGIHGHADSASPLHAPEEHGAAHVDITNLDDLALRLDDITNFGDDSGRGVM